MFLESTTKWNIGLVWYRHDSSQSQTSLKAFNSAEIGQIILWYCIQKILHQPFLKLDDDSHTWLTADSRTTDSGAIEQDIFTAPSAMHELSDLRIKSTNVLEMFIVV